eukprot:147927_1
MLSLYAKSLATLITKTNVLSAFMEQSDASGLGHHFACDFQTFNPSYFCQSTQSSIAEEDFSICKGSQIIQQIINEMLEVDVAFSHFIFIYDTIIDHGENEKELFLNLLLLFLTSVVVSSSKLEHITRVKWFRYIKYRYRKSLSTVRNAIGYIVRHKLPLLNDHQLQFKYCHLRGQITPVLLPYLDGVDGLLSIIIEYTEFEWTRLIQTAMKLFCTVQNRDINKANPYWIIARSTGVFHNKHSKLSTIGYDKHPTIEYAIPLMILNNIDPKRKTTDEFEPIVFEIDILLIQALKQRADCILRLKAFIDFHHTYSVAEKPDYFVDLIHFISKDEIELQWFVQHLMPNNQRHRFSLFSLFS